MTARGGTAGDPASPPPLGRAGKAGCDTMSTMTTKRKNILERVASLPDELLDEVEESLDGIMQFHKGGTYHATPEELKVLDEVNAEIERGEIATEEEVKAAFAAFRRA